MKIAIDAFGLRLESGVRTYTENLICALDKTEHDLTVIYATRSDKLGLQAAERVIGPAKKLFVPYRDNIKLDRHITRSDYDIFHVTRSTGPVFKKDDVCVVRTVHDLCNRYTDKQRVDTLSKIYKRLVQRRAFRNSDAVICPSESTKRQVREIFGVSSTKIHSTPLGVNGKFREKSQDAIVDIRKEYDIDDDVVLFLGMITPRKNVEKLVKAFAQSSISTDHTLLIAGGVGPNGKKIIQKIEQGYPDTDVQVTGYVSESELVGLYNLAKLFAYPSYCEGFGLPPLEAMACGTPVVVSDRSSLPEVVGDAGLTFDPSSVEEIRRRIEEMIRDDKLREDMAKRGKERASQFTWGKTAHKTVGVYRRLISSS